jgi:hypothetical protein
MSAPTSIALVKAAMVFSAAPAATPRCAATMARVMPEVCPAQVGAGEGGAGEGLSGAERKPLPPFRIIQNEGVAPLRGP